MAYIISIKTAFIYFPLIAFLITIPFILHQYHKYGSINKLRTLIIYSFILYLMCIYFLVILPLPNPNTLVPKDNMIKLIPFSFIGDFLRETSFNIGDASTYLKALCEPCFYVVVFNIFMTIPFGMYMRYYFDCDLKKTTLISLLLSLFFEFTQLTGLYFIYKYQYRVFDVDDLILNTLGGVIGYFLIGLIIKHLPSRQEIDQKSYLEGEKVSSLRRITLYCLDAFIYLVLSSMMYIFFQNKYIFLGTFIIYYLFIPLIFNNQTLGSKFLNVRLESNIIVNSLKQIFLYYYYFKIPLWIVLSSMYTVKTLDLSVKYSVYVYLSALLIILVYFIFSLICIFKDKIFYDKIFKTEFSSTIK